MVRIKHRYLLVQILYPSSPSAIKLQPSSTAPLPSIVRFHQPAPTSLTQQLLARAIKDEISELYGDHGIGITAGSFSIKYFSPATSTFILRVARAHYRLVWAALSFMTTLPAPSSRSAGRAGDSGVGQACVMRVVRVSGTIRKAEEEAIRRAKDMMLRAKTEAGLGGAAMVVEESIGRAMKEPVSARGEVLVDDDDLEDHSDYDDDSDDND